MTNKSLDRLTIKDNQVYFINIEGKEVSMPNLTALLEWYNMHKGTEIGDRIKAILSCDLEALCIAEIMIDMSSEVTKERLRTGDIAKNLKHVANYSVILDSHLQEAKEQFEKLVQEGKIEGIFEQCVFTHSPFGTLIMKEYYKAYKNTRYCKKAIEAVL